MDLEFGAIDVLARTEGSQLNTDLSQPHTRDIKMSEMEQKTLFDQRGPRMTRKRFRPGSVVALSNRVTRLAKSLKAANPTHMYQNSLSGTFAPSTTGSLYCLGTLITQGDDYNQRFGSHVEFTHLRIAGTARPGTTSAAVSTLRITVFKGAGGINFAANMQNTYNPIADNNFLRLLVDRFYSIPATQAAAGFPVNFNLNVKLRHRQKFNGTIGGTQTGDCIYVVMQSDVATGTANPLVYGTMEEYFKP